MKPFESFLAEQLNDYVKYRVIMDLQLKQQYFILEILIDM